MKNKLHYIALLTLLLVGCQSDEELKKETQRNATSPDVVATLPDGRVVYRFRDAEYGSKIYYVGDVVTAQYKQGKTTRTTVFIGGVEYTPKSNKQKNENTILRLEE